ncbi:rho GTPase-activating protein 20 [Protopterus annectens]|uniref:rho GTPase-activating protein 20 n=1 Tax=Protopterus annectens TaxID=7888 RepID=UPI001CFB2169|nr:rho GTPase-activating protein 20 [Protopterus annectens]
MEAMSPQQDNLGQSRSSSLHGESNIPGLSESKKKMKTLSQRRQSAPSLVISKALKPRTVTREACLSPISPESCPLVQSFICQTREFIMADYVQLRMGLQTQERHLFLFSDLLVIAKSKSSHFKLKNNLRICEMWTASCLDEVCESNPNPDRSFVIGWPITNYVATFRSTEEKEKWLSVLQRRIKEEKEKDHPESIPLKVFAKDLGNCASSKILTVTNEDTTHDVIKMALQNLEISGCIKDYQLWVKSVKEDAPYPLIGHENPFSIKMNHIRDATARTPVSKECVFSLDLSGSPLMEQFPQDLQCQFILRPSCLAPSHQATESSQKSFKRRRSIINWTFWRGSNAPLDSMALSPTSPVPGRLFGLPLSTICENDTLPKPVIDMLNILYQEGPFTRGIFRRSANAKSCRELKEKLDCGAEVHIDCESVFVTAVVLKDFLRNIPGSILSSELFDKWIAAMDYESHEEKLQEIQRLTELLPKPNILLLRHLFGILHSVEQQSVDNQMNAFNLAVCIAPSLLWPPVPTSPETQSEAVKKVSIFVQFLIENCCLIYGEDIASLFEDVISRQSEIREDGSDPSSFPLNDSSYDSLENELNDEVDSLCANLVQKHQEENRSRDSVLTLSDCDLDQNEVEEAEIKTSKSKAAKIFSGWHHKTSLKEHPKKEGVTSNCSLRFSDVLRRSRRRRRCSEPTISLLASQFSHLCELHDPISRKTSCDAAISHTDVNCLKQLRTLQIEGQKLINRAITMGIDLSKTNDAKPADSKNDQSVSSRLQPPPHLSLNIAATNSCSSLSSPGTSPSGSSVSSLDSAFSQYSDYSVFTPPEMSPSPNSACIPEKHEQSSGESTTVHFFDQLSPSQPSAPRTCSSPKELKRRSFSFGKDNNDWPFHKTPVTLHPNTWLKNGATTMKNWALKTKDKEMKHEEKRRMSSKTSVSDSKLKSCSPQGSDMPSNEQGQMTNAPGASENTHSIKNGKKHQSPHQVAFHQEKTPLNQTIPKEEVISRKSSRTAVHQDICNKNGEQCVESSIPCTSTFLTEESQLSDYKNEAEVTTSELTGQNTDLGVPQTLFFGQHISLCSSVSKMQPSHSVILTEDNSEHSVVQNCPVPTHGTCKGVPHSTDGNILKVQSTKETRDKEGRSGEKKGCQSVNIASSNACPKAIARHSKTIFSLSPKVKKAVKDYFTETNATNSLEKTEEVTNAMLQSKKERQQRQCNESKFEELDQILFAEESYV